MDREKGEEKGERTREGLTNSSTIAMCLPICTMSSAAEAVACSSLGTRLHAASS
jgi:hypothetical protein